MVNARSAASPFNVASPRLKRPPGPKGLPLLGNLLAFGRDQLGFVTKTARDHGDIVALNFAGWPALLLGDMDGIETILVKDHRNFIKHKFMWRQVTALFGNGLLTSEGDLWHRQRHLAAPAFAGQQLRAYDQDIVALTGRMLDRWSDGQVMDVHPAMMELTLRIAAKAFFDSEVEQDIADIDHALNDLVVEMESRFKRPFLIPDAVPLPGHVRYRKAIGTVERVVSRMISERRENGIEGRRDFLSRLMTARDDSGAPMSDRLLRDEAVTLLLAGHETTALALSWTWFLLGQHPEADARMATEITEVAGGRPLTYEDLPRLKYTESVVMESMRLYPPAWIIGRESTGCFELGGYTFAPGTMVLISPWILHRDPRYFEEPETFRPERWMGDLAHQLPRFAYMPFGGGPRICIGQRFAIMEAVLALATMAQRFTGKWQSDHTITPFPSITLRPKGGIWLRVESREKRSTQPYRA